MEEEEGEGEEAACEDLMSWLAERKGTDGRDGMKDWIWDVYIGSGVECTYSWEKCI